MKFFVSLLLLSASTLTHAAPEQADFPSMESLLENRGVIAVIGSRISSARDTVGDRASELVSSALGLLGVPYRYGGNDAENGLDCSGLVRLVYEQTVGKVLPRRAADQAAVTQAIDSSELKPGDLVFFNTMRRAFSHVGIYVGEGKFVHAPRSGSSVRVEDMRNSYWTTRFNGARRVTVSASTTEASFR